MSFWTGSHPCFHLMILFAQVEQNYTYVFNICGAVSGGLPRSCDFVENIEKAGAVQLDQRGTDSTQDDYCYLVGQFNDASTKLELLNQEDPTEGLQLTYYGAYCRGLISSVQRQFNIQLTCANRLSPVPTQALELKPCIYTIQMPSIYGCPLECPVSNRQLCGGQGHCAFDPDKHAARCFCNNGSHGFCFSILCHPNTLSRCCCTHRLYQQ